MLICTCTYSVSDVELICVLKQTLRGMFYNVNTNLLLTSCDASSYLVMLSRNVPSLWCVLSAFCVSISLPSPAPPVWLLTFSSLHGWSGYWLDLGTQCTNTEIRRERERGSQADIAAVPTPLHSPPLAPDTGKKEKTCSSRLHSHWADTQTWYLNTDSRQD